MSTTDILNEARSHMGKSVKALAHEFSTVRTGRASSAVLDGIMIDYYGTPTPITQMAGVKTPEAQMLLIEPWDKSMLKEIEHAIQASDLGITPSNDGSVIRLPFPALTEERRKELIKVVHKEGESARVAVRNIRRDANTHLKDLLKQKKVAEDEERRAQDEVQKLTDRYIVEIDKMLALKETDLAAG